LSLFVTFEGSEGSGKTSQWRELHRHLSAVGHRVYATREPGGTRISDAVRSIVLNPEYGEMLDTTEILLFAAARAQLVGEEIRRRLAAGDIVLSDRYADSTLAYQGYGDQLDMDALRVITKFATGGLVPDLTFYLDVPVEVGLARKRGQAAEEWNRMEQKDLEYFERVRAGYLEMAAAEPDRWRVLDGALPFEEIQKEIREEVERSLKG
jgi:dTMP kinase